MRDTYFIKQNSTLGEIKFSLNHYLLEEYNITDDMMENVAVTFSMTDSSNDQYVIANSEAKLIVKNNDYEKLDDCKYELAYRPNLMDTSVAGIFYGEFTLDFLGEYCGKIKLPTHNSIKIVIDGSITKTTITSAPLGIFGDTFDNTFG